MHRVSCTKGSMMKKPKRPGRPARPVVTLPATAEEIARRFFDNAKPSPPEHGAEKDPKPYQSDEKPESED